MTEGKATKTVKAISTSAWDRARRAAARTGEPLGEWLGRAIEQLAELEAGDRIIPPQRFVGLPAETLPIVPNLPATICPSLPEIASVITALASAGLPIQKRIGRRVNTLLFSQLR